MFVCRVTMQNIFVCDVLYVVRVFCFVCILFSSQKFCEQMQKYWNIIFIYNCTIYHHYVPIGQWSQTQFLEGHSSAEFRSNQLQITLAWKFLEILKTLFRAVGLQELSLVLVYLKIFRHLYWKTTENHFFAATRTADGDHLMVLSSSQRWSVLTKLYKRWIKQHRDTYYC